MSIVGKTHGDENLEALDEDVLFLGPTSSSMRRLGEQLKL
jgi:hypothetical protein